MALPVRRRDEEVEEAPARSPLAELERLSRQLGGFTPLADLEETPDAYLVEVEVPGVRREDIDVELADRRVWVRGERKEKERVGILRRRERTVGRFACEVLLPGDVEDDGVQAHLDGGVLTLRLPKPERDRPRRIEIR